MNNDDLELVGVVLYKCEGTKLRKDNRYPNGNTFYYAIDFCNSDPVLVRLFVDFVRKILNADEAKIKAELFLYDDIDERKVMSHWSQVLDIPLERFQKTILLKQKSGLFKPSLLGTCKIRFSDKKVFIKLNQLIVKRLGNDASLIK